jgi:hypothetical protein
MQDSQNTEIQAIQSFVPKDSCRKNFYGFESIIIPDENPPIQRSPRNPPKSL